MQAAIVGYLLDPFLLFFVLTAVGLIALWWRHPGWRRSLLLAILPFTALSLVCIPAVAHWAAASLEWWYPPLAARPPQCQAIVVLSGYVHPPEYGQPEPELADDTYRRCLQAARVYRQGDPCLVVASGGKLGRDAPDLALAVPMCDFLQRQGVAPEHLLAEQASRNTYENARETAKLLRERGIRKIVLVTDAIHLWRAEQCFVAQGLEVTPCGCHYRARELEWSPSNFLPSASAAKDMEKVLHEWVGITWYKLTGRL